MRDLDVTNTDFKTKFCDNCAFGKESSGCIIWNMHLAFCETRKESTPVGRAVNTILGSLIPIRNDVSGQPFQCVCFIGPVDPESGKKYFDQLAASDDSEEIQTLILDLFTELNLSDATKASLKLASQLAGRPNEENNSDDNLHTDTSRVDVDQQEEEVH